MDDDVLPGMNKGHEEMAEEILSCRRRRNRFFWIHLWEIVGILVLVSFV